ncbi:sensor domain-containing phosphodiesterase [Thalassotalea eurytherma]|uniref:Bifunctional diguanylate cyclase/phosphodiesterase n=1 Tax=Thalassotalea eurytherma TaxID=1144278 RepID=A0ABQ6H8D3_9GAMM|nr:EAL domain-containing protein [Thalassotalea eurytherma]GLX83116.1 bifunctional diguanylate cyclase/phosphodiesterase [Thalassotalea eurytherma]
MTKPQNLTQLVEQNKKVQQELDSLKKEYQYLADRHDALFKLNSLLSECKDIHDFYFQVHNVVASLMVAYNFYIVLYDQTFEELEFVYHVDEYDKTPIGKIPFENFNGSLTNYVIRSGKALLATPERLAELKQQDEISNVGSDSIDWLGVPLIDDGYIVGVIAVQSYTESTRYQQDDLDMLNFAAQHIVSALTYVQDTERLQKAVSARTTELMEQIREREKSELLQESLFRISELASESTVDLDHFYSQVHNIVGQLINASNFFVAKYQKESDTLSFLYFVDQLSENEVQDFKPRKMSNHYTELVIRSGKEVLLDRDKMYALYQQNVTSKPQGNSRSWLGVPLKIDDQIIGAMVIQSYQSDVLYTESDSELLNFVAQHVANAIKRRESIDYERRTHELLEEQVQIRTQALEEEIKQRKQAESLLKHSAAHDALTGLPNRTVFIDLVDHAIACQKRRNDMQFAVLFLDLDRFKVVNDSLGHHAGDLLLKIIAKELKYIIREKDTVARLGGDEFVILIEDLDDHDEAYEIAQRITEMLERPFDIEKQPVFIGASIGVLFSDDRYASADIMLRDADTAMYHAKDKGKGRFEVFDASMHQKVQNALTLETDMREAIDRSEFLPYFQPIVNLDNEAVVGFEALARWQSDKRGFVYPSEFISLAEETGLVMQIDLQILEKCCKQLQTWKSLGSASGLYVSCNLYCNHFFNPTLPDEILKITEAYGIEPTQIRLEITERALLENNHIVLANMNALQQLGFKILLDDFGTGYSSLSYLHRFPIDVLKIDRSFITNLQEHESNRAIIKTIIDLATNLQMATVGEGIEHEQEAKLLQRMDCNYGQGFYFAKPMSADDVIKTLELT